MKKIFVAALLALLSACSYHVKPPDLVLGIAVAYVDGQPVDAEVLGKANSMEDCHQFAKQALAAQPPGPVKLIIVCEPIYTADAKTP